MPVVSNASKRLATLVKRLRQPEEIRHKPSSASSCACASRRSSPAWCGVPRGADCRVRRAYRRRTSPRSVDLKTPTDVRRVPPRGLLLRPGNVPPPPHVMEVVAHQTSMQSDDPGEGSQECAMEQETKDPQLAPASAAMPPPGAAGEPDPAAADDDALRHLSVEAVDRDQFEAGVMRRVDEELGRREKERAVAIRLKELKSVALSLGAALEAAKKCERALDAVFASSSSSSSYGSLSRRKSENLLREQESANAKKEDLACKQSELVRELAELGHDVEKEKSVKLVRVKLDGSEKPENEGDGDALEEGEVQEETETERSIRLGERTAFGKSLKSHTESDGGESFRRYVQDQKALNQVAASSSSSKPQREVKARRRKGEKLKKRAREKVIRYEDEDEEEEEAGDVGAGNGTDDSDWGSTDDEGEPRSGRWRHQSSSRRRATADDGDRDEYLERLERWQEEQEEEEGALRNRSEQLEGGLRVPSSIWEKLYGYQRVCVQWLWELHQQRVGGILGDEMGLGKTIQIIAFAASMSFSCKSSGGRKFGPVLIVCPTTVMHQWVQEFHKWWPIFRVAVLHESGSHRGSRSSLIRSIAASRGVLVTSYNGLVTFKDVLLEQGFQYVILDEGHKIRNPDAQVTLAAKSFQTPHRLILSGSPLQNNLKELWSLFDFIYPGKLGTLPVFMQQFSVPITQGGYSNATRVQVATAYKCATVLRDTINPYLLRRMKADVKQHINLPQKNEQILFCRLTDEQRDTYKSYLDSGEIKGIMDGRIQVFVGLINLRKICNHPDLFDGGPRPTGDEDYDRDESRSYGYWKRSGKMIVVHSLLKLWKRQGHRVLLFTQSKQMLLMLERYVLDEGYDYLKMDGGTAIASRQPLIAKFNSSPDIFVFLLTTKVGGLGINLTGASRVVIFDPDWNPSTDTQARERAWRIGQDKQVTIYRLMTAGTIEEKIYHRQIFKQFLVNRVLKDPKQRRFFKSNDLYELFTLNEGTSDRTETSAIFAGTGSEVKVTKTSKRKRHRRGDGDGEAADARSVVPSFKPRQRRGMETSDVKASLDRLLKSGDEEGEEATSRPLSDREKLMEKVRRISRKIGGGSASGPDREEEKRKSKHRKDKKVEGERISFLVKKRQFKAAAEAEGGDNGNDDEEKEKCSEEQDNYVLSRLLKKSGVHSAVQHDVIVEGEGDDYVLIEGEAERVAKEAVDELRRSRRECFRAEAGVPTWTGASGAMARPRFGAKAKKRKREDKSSSLSSVGERRQFDGSASGKRKMHTADDLLARMRQRNKYLPTSGRGQDDGELFRPDVPSQSQEDGNREHLELLSDIRNFVAFQARRDGEATTSELVERFSDRVPPKESPLFKSLLNEICNFEKRERGEGMWRLKSEFA